MKEDVKIEFFKCSIHNQTFRVKDIRNFVEENVHGKVLNLFCGTTELNVDEIRNDIDEKIEADYNKEALDFVRNWKGGKFDSVILDPPYSYRKSMEYYNGHRNSKFKQLKDIIPDILNPGGVVITFGYQSISMGKCRGFKLLKVGIFCHGGAYHDTIASVEEKMKPIMKNVLRIVGRKKIEDIFKYLEEDIDCEPICIVSKDKIKGKKQTEEEYWFKYVYITQWTQSCCDDYHGVIFIPLNKDDFLKVVY